MLKLRLFPMSRAGWLLNSVVLFGFFAAVTSAQKSRFAAPVRDNLKFHVSKQAERLEIMVNTSRIVTLDNKIPRVFVNDTTVVQAAPISPTQVQLSGLKPGVTQVNMWDETERVYSLDIVVIRDARELEELLRSEFPETTLRVRPLSKSVYITGYVPRPEMIDEILQLAEDYYDHVINGITVGGVQQVALHVKVLEVSRSKLRELGLDWEFSGDNFAINQMSGRINASPEGPAVEFSLFGNTSEFIGYLAALRQQDLIKVLSEPTLVTMTGRPATFNAGGSFPILVPNGLGTTSVEFRQYGTRVDFVPTVLGNGNIRLEVRPSVSELDPTRGVEIDGVQVPGVTERSVDTAVEMQAGQTLALAGLIQQRVESRNTGIPFLGDLPWVGRAFSKVEERVNEIELLVVVTPELIGPMDPHQVPQCGPGQLTGSPNDAELYNYGYVEVPNCGLHGDGAGPVMAAPQAMIPPAASPAPGTSSESILQDPTPQVTAPSTPTAPTAPASAVRAAMRPALIGPMGYDPLN